MIYLLKLTQFCKSLLRSIFSTLILITNEGKSMETQFDKVTRADHEHLINMFIILEFRSILDRLLYHHWTTGTDV